MIVLTGAHGFIGKHFKSKIHSAIEVDKENCWRFLEEFEDWDKVSLIIHQGAISSTTETDIRLIHRYNVEFTLCLFELAIQYGIPVKYASSASVYGNLQGIANPLNYYALSKLQIDYWVLDNLHRFSQIQGFRYFNVYGCGEEKKGDQASPVSKFRKQIKESGFLQLFEGSENYFRDFVWVGDLVDLVLNNTKGSGVYDLGTGKPVSFRHVAECVADRFEGKIELVPFPKHLVGKYQSLTCAKPEWGEHQFSTVESYLNGLK